MQISIDLASQLTNERTSFSLSAIVCVYLCVCCILQLPQEAPAVIPDRRPPSNWPSAGEVDIKNLTLKVRSALVDNVANVVADVVVDVVTDVVVAFHIEQMCRRVDCVPVVMMKALKFVVFLHY